MKKWKALGLATLGLGISEGNFAHTVKDIQANITNSIVINLNKTPEEQVAEINQEIQTKQQKLSDINLTTNSTEAEKDYYIALFNEISDLQVKKESLMTIQMLLLEIKNIKGEIVEYQKQLQLTTDKVKQFKLNSDINKSKTLEQHYKNILKEKITKEKTITLS